MADIYGTEGQDSLNGFGGGDRLFGLGGNDSLYGGDGFDQLFGGFGRDTYYIADLTPRYFSGQLLGYFPDAITELPGEGIDTVHVNSDATNPLFGVGSYVLPSEVENGLIYDSVFAEPLDFDLTGNGGANALFGNGAQNALRGLGGNDRLEGGLGRDTLAGGVGNDSFLLFDLTALMLNGVPVDYRYDDIVEQAGEGIDTVEVRVRDNPLTLFATDGYTLVAQIENGRIVGAGAFDLSGNELNNRLSGEAGNDILQGNAGFDILVGGSANDSYYLGDITDRGGLLGFRYDGVAEGLNGGTDTVFLTAFNTAPFAVPDSYQLGRNVENLVMRGDLAFDAFGNGLANRMFGNGGANFMRAGGGADSLRGGGGDDILSGSGGNDFLRGDAGADGFRFDSRLSAVNNVDRILDFAAADDTILLSRAIFGAFADAGTIPGAAFQVGTSANDAADRIIYNQATGAIFYDPDGSGAAAQILFARVSAGTMLTSADFSVFGG